MFGSFWVFRSFLKLEFLFGEEMKLVLYWKLIVVCVVFFFLWVWVMKLSGGLFELVLLNVGIFFCFGFIRCFVLVLGFCLCWRGLVGDFC